VNTDARLLAVDGLAGLSKTESALLELSTVYLLVCLVTASSGIVSLRDMDRAELACSLIHADVRGIAQLRCAGGCVSLGAGGDLAPLARRTFSNSAPSISGLDGLRLLMAESAFSISDNPF
jgi:hypothetical protein